MSAHLRPARTRARASPPTREGAPPPRGTDPPCPLIGIEGALTATAGARLIRVRLLRGLHLQALGFPRQRIPIDAQETRRLAQLAARALQRLPQYRAVHLIDHHPVEVGNALSAELIKEVAETEIQKLFQRQLHRI